MTQPLSPRLLACALCRSAALVVFVLSGSVSASAQGTATQGTAAPILQVETSFHEAPITDAASDDQGRVLVTSSHDKTARIWSLPDLRPLGVLRPALHGEDDGKLYAVAVSPDGRFAAVGGWTGIAGNQAVLIFNLATQQLVRRIDGLPRAAVALAYSRDGGRLAAGMGGTAGIAVWDTSAWNPVFRDGPFQESTYGLSFSLSGQLATASLDGTVRLYGGNGRLTTKVRLDGKRQPSRIAFSRDGALLALGMFNSLGLEVHDGRTLALRTRPDTAALPYGDLTQVSWSSTGHLLLASGSASGGAVFAWSRDGAGPRQVADPGFTQTSSGLLALPGGAIVTASGAGDLAVTIAGGDAVRGSHVAERHPIRHDFGLVSAASGAADDLLLSGGGMGAAWPSANGRDGWLRFDARAPDLVVQDAPQSGMAGPSDGGADLMLSNWRNLEHPLLNGKALVLDPDEVSESVAVTPGRVLIGTSWFLRCFDRDGRPLWSTPLAALAQRVTPSREGRLVVAALADGTIRWFRLSDGKELLAVFATADGARWIAFTPSGYYAASVGGEDLAGWHVGRGALQAGDFFPMSRFRVRYYRPDVVTRMLTTLDEEQALRDADVARGSAPVLPGSITDDLPPVVTILSPTDGTRIDGTEVEVRYSVRSPSGRPVKGVEVRVNGRPPSARGLGRVSDGSPGKDTDTAGSVVVTLPVGRSVELAVFATTATKTGEPARVKLFINPPDAPAPELLPRMNAVIIGVSNYVIPGMELQFAAKDAQDMGNLLEQQRGRGLYREVNVHVLPDSQATRSAVMRQLDWLRRQTTSNDVAVVFLAGHGVLEEGKTFFLPTDGDPDQLFATAVGQGDLQTILSSVPGRVVAFIDICHAGSAVFAQGQRSPPDIPSLVNQLRDPGSGLIVFASSTARQPSQELESLHNGAFTAALLEGLKGEADFRHRGAVRTDELNVYVADRVRDLTRGRQSPVMQRPGDIPDFPIVLDLPGEKLQH